MRLSGLMSLLWFPAPFLVLCAVVGSTHSLSLSTLYFLCLASLLEGYEKSNNVYGSTRLQAQEIAAAHREGSCHPCSSSCGACCACSLTNIPFWGAGTSRGGQGAQSHPSHPQPEGRGSHRRGPRPEAVGHRPCHLLRCGPPAGCDC